MYICLYSKVCDSFLHCCFFAYSKQKLSYLSYTGNPPFFPIIVIVQCGLAHTTKPCPTFTFSISFLCFTDTFLNFLQYLPVLTELIFSITLILVQPTNVCIFPRLHYILFTVSWRPGSWLTSQTIQSTTHLGSPELFIHNTNKF